MSAQLFDCTGKVTLVTGGNGVGLAGAVRGLAWTMRYGGTE